MKILHIIKINIKSIRFNWKKDLGSVAILSLFFGLFFSIIIGSLSFVKTLDTATKDSLFGPKKLTSTQKVLNSTLTINSDTEFLLGLKTGTPNGKVLSTKTCGFEMVAPLVVTKESFGSNFPFAFPCFINGALYDSFVLKDSLKPRTDNRIPVLIPTNFVKNNVDIEHKYSAKELQDNYDKILGKVFRLKITEPANQEFIKYFSDFVFNYLTKPEVLVKINDNVNERVNKSQDASFEVVVVGFVKEEKPNIIFPDWFKTDERGDKLTNKLINYQETKIFEAINSEPQFQYKSPSKEVYHNFYDNILVLYVSSFILGIILIFVLISTSKNIFNENKEKYKLLGILGMNEPQLILFKTVKILILFLSSCIFGLILSFVSNSLIVQFTRETIFGFIYSSISNPLFSPENIKLFWF